MRFIVDTSVWSLAFRRHAPSTKESAVHKLQWLIEHGEELVLLGIIYQELLQGIRDPKQFRELRNALVSFPLLEPVRDDYAAAAELTNRCMSNGIQLGTIDSLIAAMAIRHRCRLLTADRDFTYIAKHAPLQLA